MTSFFTYYEGSILVRLLIAHCLVDFLLQPTAWVIDKKARVWSSRYLYIHGALAGALSWLFLWSLNWWWAILVITVTHLLIDGLKLQLEKKLRYIPNADFKLFILDQLLHISVIICTWLFIINGWHNWVKFINATFSDYSFLLKTLGYIFVAGPVGFIVHFSTRKWTKDLTTNDSLQNAGKWIGILERILILTMVFINQFSAIGFFVAAKSILRVTDKPDKPVSDPTLGRPFSSRKHTEYILIGTFLSVGIAIFTGLIINALLKQ
jgi:hypothetical protein